MASNIDATIPVAGSLIQAGPLQLNFYTIKQEIEALQAQVSAPCVCNVTVGAAPPFPPTTGMLWFDSGSAQLYVYDGCQWIIAVHTGEGDGAGAPEWGVMDGSNARPGQVGEYLSVFTEPSLMTRLNESAWDNSPLDQLASLTLSAGDWEVTGWIAIEQTGPPTTYIAAYMGPMTGTTDTNWGADNNTWWMIRNVTAQDITPFLGPIRISSAAPTQINLQIEVVTAGAAAPVAVPASARIAARRMR